MLVVLVNSILHYCTLESILELAICVAFLYWAFPHLFSEGVTRVNKMVDVVTNRMFDTFSRFNPRDNHQTDSLSSISTLKRFSKDQKFRRQLTRETDQKTRDSQLFDIKENIPDVVLPKKRPFMGLSCQNCTNSSRESLVSKTTKTVALKNILRHEFPASENGLLQKTFSDLCQVYALKKFEYVQVADLVLQNERLKQAIEKTAVQQFKDASDETDDEFYQKLLQENGKRARKLLYDMRSTLSDFLLRFTSWVLYKLLPCFLTSVVVHPGQVEMLKKAGDSNVPLIFLPLHKSHLDYILISFILLNNNIRSPLVAAGDNLRIPFFGSLLRGLGAFFIKRRISPVQGRRDLIYRSVLHTYVQQCLRSGHNLEFFLEGGRTRTGRPRMPKLGVLSVVVESFLDGTVEDALLVPVSVNYEKLVDGNFIREQLGEKKQMETFGSAIRGIWHVLNSNYGMMRIDFNQPFSLRELVHTFDMTGKIPKASPSKKVLQSNPSTTSLFGTDVVSEENKSLVESISKHIIYDCAQSTSVMSTNALAFLLLNKFRNGVTMDDLIVAFDQLKDDLIASGKDIGFTGDSIDVINYAISILGPGLVRKEKTSNDNNTVVMVKPNAILPNVVELSYYSNTLVTHFALESIVCASIATLDSSDAPQDVINYEKLLETVLDLCDLLQYEFVLHKPCQSLEQVVVSVVDNLIYSKHILIVENTVTNERSRKIAQQFNDDDAEQEEIPHVVYKINRDVAAQEELRYLGRLVMPLVDSYFVTAFILNKLDERQLLEEDLLNDILTEMRAQLANGSLSYEESVSIDSVRNALKLFQKMNVLECYSEKKMRLYYLKDNEEGDLDQVKRICDRIDRFRQSQL
ncbi:glycerol-3-phosphate acyltransferase 1, mitochondrial isoform X2 [Aethina tumida]|uniref:glycerol-3-phosphate acyltransferase 1, mitochondrial isoform X2 n=1 Tax=Aethina tumida TaxID=116153 RepID=UPI002147FC0C|nr:glycerol-3-phosphate acyltransferase 1, mitochondrial isoform X2 [Aethina tumida]